MKGFVLKDLEKLTGINSATLRVWERRYGLMSPNRTSTNRRLYNDDDLKRIINISVLYRNGVKISRIARMSDSEITDKVAFLSRETSGPDTRIDSLIKATIRLDEPAVNEIMLHLVLNNGFEASFTEIVFPFLRKIGFLWQTGHLNAGIEHFISGIFRRKLFTAIDSISASSIPKKKKVVLYLPEDELHEIGMLFYLYLIRKLGHDTLYLGQTTPFNSVVEVSNAWQPDLIITSLRTAMPVKRIEDYLELLSTSLRKRKVLVAGLFADLLKEGQYTNVFAVRSEEDLKRYL